MRQKAVNTNQNLYSLQFPKKGLQKKDLKKLLKIATGGYFLYRNKLYCQIDGVTMGIP